MLKSTLQTWLLYGIICSTAPLGRGQLSAQTRINEAPYHSWNQALIIGNGKVEAVVVPEVGRIMQFRFVGEEDGPFWENRALDGQTPDPKSNEWGNFGGDKTWPSPQSDWEKITGRGWPPPVAFDSMPLQARIDREEIVLESSVDPHFGIHTERRISLAPDKSEMKVRTIYVKKSGKPIATGIWTITQMKDPRTIFMPLRKDSIFPTGYNKQSADLPDGLKIEGGILRCERSPKRNSKIGSDAEILAWANARWVLKIVSHREKEGHFPDQGSSAEIYTNADPLRYIELELLGPVKEMKVGDRTEREQTYELFRRSSTELEQQMETVLSH